MGYRVDSAQNNTAVASAGSKNQHENYENTINASKLWKNLDVRNNVPLLFISFK